MSAVVVTGLGAVHPFGRGAASLWAGVLGAGQGVRSVRRFDASRLATRFAASVPEDTRAALPEPGLEWASRYGLAAVVDALEDAGLPTSDVPAEESGLFFGFETTSGDFELAARTLHRAWRDGEVDAERLQRDWWRGLAPGLAWGLHEGFLRAVGARLGSLETVRIVGAACASGAEAIGAALRAIRSGRLSLAVAGAADAKVNPIGLGLTCQIGMTSRRNDDPARASRPFDRTRDGAVVGEGAAALVLESEERARRRGARVLARLSGFGSTCDAHRLTDPEESGAMACEAIRRALADAAVERVDYVNGHGTATAMNDRIEVAALERAFSPDSVPPLSSTKGATGHLMAASGAIEAVVSVLALREQTLPPTLHCETLEKGWTLDIVRGAPRTQRVDRVLSNSFGFGGQNACLVFERASDDQPANRMEVPAHAA